MRADTELCGSGLDRFLMTGQPILPLCNMTDINKANHSM